MDDRDDDIRVEREGNGWRLVDRKGGFHSARIVSGGKARAQRQADALNEQLRRVREGFSHKEEGSTGSAHREEGR